MTYEQSLKNMVYPLELHHVFFNFSSNSDFKIIFYSSHESKNISELIKTKFRTKLPFGRIQTTPLGHEVLYYEDPLFRYKYDLTTQDVLINDQKKGVKNSVTAELSLEMNKLLFKLKNM